MKNVSRNRFSIKKLFVSVLFFFILPATVAYAGFFALLGDLFTQQTVSWSSKNLNSQNTSLLASEAMAHTSIQEEVADATSADVVGSSALYAEAGPGGAMADVDGMDGGGHGTISLYVVRSGDSLASIAKMFDVSVNTILWANDIPRGTPLKIGQTLAILPVSGVRHTVKSGDTITKIAAKYKGDADEISQYNGIDVGTKLAIGDIVIVPDGEVATVVVKKIVPASSKLHGASGPTYGGYYASPLASYKKTQGLHGYNGVDLTQFAGAPVMAAADGTVIIARQGGYNGGYGNYVVIAHNNGTQTLYGHMLNVSVVSGQNIAQGQTIGSLGNSGRSTGPHLHFEVRGARNPF
jgi:murein DD-endopeptidase MepM/ murein hydrolase activator NlpD